MSTPTVADTRRRTAETDEPPAPFAVRRLGWVLVVGGALGFAAAFALTVEKIILVGDPTYVPTCSINPLFSCGSVMVTPQAGVFGFPNPLLGIVGFSVVTTIGVVQLSGARLPAWMWWGMQAGTVFGVGFVHWLFFQSLYRIGALCPYCMVVWVVTIAIFWYVTLFNLQQGHLKTPPRLRPVVSGLVSYHTVGLLVWLLILTGLIGVRFWSYWQTLL